MTTQTQRQRSPVSVEAIPCPDCGHNTFRVIAEGPDYDHHCCGDQTFKLVRCNHCDLAYLNPRPTLDMLPVIYDVQDYCCYGYTENRPRLAQASRRFESGRTQLLLSLRPDLPAQQWRILDIGTGEGRSLLAFHEVGTPLDQLYANDISVDVLAPLKDTGMQLVVGRAEEIDLPAGTFDLVMMNQVIEHVADPRRVMEISYRLLKPGGLLVMETPNLDGWDRAFFARRRWGGYHFPRHWVLFSTQTMTRMMTEAGFQQIDILDISGAFVWTWNFNHTFQDWKLPKALYTYFVTENFGAMFIGAAIDALPRRFFHSSNMRAIGRKPAP